MGIVHAIGSGHVYFVLNIKGEVLDRLTVTKTSNDESKTKSIIDQMKEFDQNIKKRIDTYSNAIFAGDNKTSIEIEESNIIPFKYDDENNSPGKSDHDLNDILCEEMRDEFLGAHIIFPHQGSDVEGVIKY